MVREAQMAKKSDMAADIIGLVKAGTKKWTRTVKAEERNPVSRSYRYARMMQKRGVSFKDAAEQIMEEAHNKVSDNGELPAKARQVMYAARPYIQEKTGKPLKDSYFTQTLLPNYVMEHDVAWNVIYDARGNFVEPHDGKTFGLGTLEVRNYLAALHDPRVVEAALKHAQIETCGPNGNFGALLFVEKEGFMPLLKAVRLAERFDIAVMSTKGVSVTAARELADNICYDFDIPLLTLRDLDKSGFVISGTLQRDTRRYEFQNAIKTLDTGLSLKDVEEMNLPFEHQYIEKANKVSMMDNLRENGATEAEIAFMFADFDRTRSLRRVELNAMTSRQFVDLIERKLRENDITKIVPDQDELAEAYRMFERGKLIEAIVEREIRNFNGAAINVPDNLEQRVRELLDREPTLPWSESVQRIVGT
jgi:hypothetical protein